VNPNDKRAEEKFKEISQANDVFERREEAEDLRPGGVLFGLDRSGGGGGGARGGYGGGFAGADFRAGRARADRGGQEVRFDLEGFDFSDFQSAAGTRAAGRRSRGGRGLRGSFKDIFGGMFQRRAQGARAGRAPDLEYQVSVDFWSAVRGGVARLGDSSGRRCARRARGSPDHERRQRCPGVPPARPGDADGGRYEVQHPVSRCAGRASCSMAAPTCNGEGVVARRSRWSPASRLGRAHGQRYGCRAGNAGTDGGALGDLLLIEGGPPVGVYGVVADEQSINSSPLTMTEARRLVGEDRVPTIRYNRRRRADAVKIPPAGRRPGQKLRLRERACQRSARGRGAATRLER